MTNVKKFASRELGFPRCVIPTQWLGMCMFAALVAIGFSATTATAQDFRATEAIVRAKMAQADVVKLRADFTAAKAECGRLKAGGGSSSSIKKIEARIAALELEINRKVGCAAFTGAAEQSFCLATVARVSAETTQVGLEVAQHLNQRTFMKSRSTETKVVNGVAVTTTDVDYAELTARTSGGAQPCFDYTDLTGGTAETPGTVRQIKCHDPPRVTEYEGRPIVPPTFVSPPPAEETSWPRWVKVVTTTLVGVAVLGGAGAGIGYGLSENSLDPNTGERKDNRARNAGIGAGIGSAIAVVGGIPLGFAF